MANLPSQGTQFSDSVRVGPIFGSQYAAAIGSGPPVALPSPAANRAPGTQLAPWAVYDFTPIDKEGTSIVLSTVTVGAGYLTLAPQPVAGTTLIRKFGLNVIQLDVPRAVSVTLAGGGTIGDLIVTGYDENDVPMQELIRTIAGQTVNGRKAFKWVSFAYYSAASVSAIEVGTANTFGLPWRVDSPSYLYAMSSPDYNVDTVYATNDFVMSGELTAGSLTLPLPANLVEPEEVLVSCTTAQGTQGFLSAVITGNSVVVTSTDAADTSDVVVLVLGPKYNLNFLPIFAPAYQAVDGDNNPEPSTLTTPDVRGTISLESIADHQRVTIFAYVLGANPLIEPSIQALPEYIKAKLPTATSWLGYPQFWATPFSGT